MKEEEDEELVAEPEEEPEAEPEKPRKPAKADKKKDTKKSAATAKKKEEAKTEAPTSSANNRDGVTPDPDPADIPVQNPETVRHEGKWYWLLKAEPETRFEGGVDVRFSIDDLRARTKPEGWDGEIAPLPGLCRVKADSKSRDP